VIVPDYRIIQIRETIILIKNHLWDDLVSWNWIFVICSRVMNMNNKKIYYGIFAALCIVGLAVGIAGATEITGAVKGCTGMYGGMHGSGTGPCKSMENRITCLESQGIDVTELKTAYAKGDSEAVRAWFIAFHEAHPDRGPGHMSGNCTPCVAT